jgi:hypothetical protein
LWAVSKIARPSLDHLVVIDCYISFMQKKKSYES